MEAIQNAPKPLFMRLLALVGTGGGGMLIGTVFSIAEKDVSAFFLSLAVFAFCAAQVVSLYFVIKKEDYFVISGVCTGKEPILFARYNRVELMDEISGDEQYIVLPKKTKFKVGVRYQCYLQSTRTGATDLFLENDLPTQGFLGYESLGVFKAEKTNPKNKAETNTTKEEELLFDE